MNEPTTPAAGWYPDPAGGGGLRWWTGVTWTDATRPSPWATETPTVPLPDPAPQVPRPVVEPGSFVPVVDVPPEGTTAYPDPSDDTAAPGHRAGAAWLVVGAAVLLVAIAAGVVVLLGSVSSRNKLDTLAIEDDIASRVAARTGLGATVDCPDSVDIVAGSTFTCSVTTADGTQLDVVVVQQDDQGNVTISGIPQ